jgi:hypothetical protein
MCRSNWRARRLPACMDKTALSPLLEPNANSVAILDVNQNSFTDKYVY